MRFRTVAFLPLALVLAFILSACAPPVPQSFVEERVANFSTAVKHVSAGVTSGFDAAEREHFEANSIRLTLEYLLGGTPKLETEPLFDSRTLEVRRHILDALRAYAVRLGQVATGKPPTELEDRLKSLSERVGGGLLRPLDGLGGSQLALSRILGNSEISLVEDGIADLTDNLAATVSETEVGIVVAKAQPGIEKIGLLLYIDIGSPEDKSVGCAYGPPQQPDNVSVDTVVLCAGGLRGLTATAVRDQVATHRDMIALQRESSKNDFDAARKAVAEMIDVQRRGRELDNALAGTQSAIQAMVRAHTALQAVRNATAGEVDSLIGDFLDKAQEVTRAYEKLDALYDKATEGEAS